MMNRRFLAALLFTLALTLDASAKVKKTAPKRPAPPRAEAAEPDAAPKTLPNGVPVVHASSVVVLDARSGEVLYEKNADQHRPPASTQKLLTSLIVAEAGNLDKPVTVDLVDTFAEPVKLNIQPGEVYRRFDLLQVLLVHSMNDVARCLARDNAGSIELFADRMNRKAAGRHDEFAFRKPKRAADPRPVFQRAGHVESRARRVSKPHHPLDCLPEGFVVPLPGWAHAAF